VCSAERHTGPRGQVGAWLLGEEEAVAEGGALGLVHGDVHRQAEDVELEAGVFSCDPGLLIGVSRNAGDRILGQAERSRSSVGEW